MLKQTSKLKGHSESACLCQGPAVLCFNQHPVWKCSEKWNKKKKSGSASLCESAPKYNRLVLGHVLPFQQVFFCVCVCNPADSNKPAYRLDCMAEVKKNKIKKNPPPKKNTLWSMCHIFLAFSSYVSLRACFICQSSHLGTLSLALVIAWVTEDVWM